MNLQTKYHEDEMLLLSGIQHFRFCPRQWALIHIEQQWEENHLTIEGQLLHKHVDEPWYRQKCGEYITLRSVNIASQKLGLYGITDLIELHPSETNENAIMHPSYPGFWKPYPIEYKRGKPKSNNIDEVQLTAQAMCLEEQYGIHIEKGAFYYGETHHRSEIIFSDNLRNIVIECAIDMHKIYKDKVIPNITHKKHCENCSLKNICMPNSVRCTKVSTYLAKYLHEKTP